MNVIIIEDERRTANELKMILEQLDPEINVQGILMSVSTAIDWLKHHPAPDLVFSDIQLGDGLSFEIFREVEVVAPVIFCTAFDEYAIEAFEANGVDYLLKPLEEEMIERSLRKYHRLKKVFSSENVQKAVKQIEATYKQFILVHFRDKIVPVKVDDLDYVYATNGVVLLNTTDKNEYVVPYTVDQLEGMLNPQHFFKANRQFILNRRIVLNIEHYFNRRLLVKTSCPLPAKVIISRLKAQEFLRWMEQ
jgi:two-component system, LytTR family, response regulator LytT